MLWRSISKTKFFCKTVLYFFFHYTPTTKIYTLSLHDALPIFNVLMKYDEIENSRLDNAVTVDSKRKLEEVIAKAAIAIEQEVTNQMKAGILDVSAETDV